jgi:1-acyl-sn-glycerol-3-phosphate acyltransferase
MKEIGESMLTILLITMSIVLSGLSIYLFDYRVDGIINNVFIIIPSLLVGALITALLLGLFLELYYMYLPKNKLQKSMFAHKIVKQVASVPLHFSRMKIKVVGKEHLPKDPGFTIYTNHSTWIDPTIIMNGLYNYPVAALGKEWAFKIFVIGKFAPLFGFVMIKRSDPRQSAQAIKQVVSNVKDGFSMVIFPEGTRSPNVDSLLDFKDGAFKVALRSERPIVPITIVKPTNYKSIKWPFKKRVTLVIHKPLLFEDFKDLKTFELSKIVKEIIENPFKN